MSRISLVFLLGLVLSSPAAAATWADSLFEELSKDFGSVPRGPTLTHSFKVVNKTKQVVTIGQVRVSCGCVSASAMKNRLNPGEETVILASMDTTRFIGSKSVTVYVPIVEPQFEEVRLLVQAYGRDDLNLTPDTLALGTHKRGSTPSAAVTLTFYGITGAVVTGATCESNYVEPTVAEKKRDGGTVSYQITAKLRNDCPAGKWFADVWITTNITGMNKLRVPLTVEVEAALDISPRTVNLGEVKPGAEAERRLTVRGAKPFKITTIEGAADGLKVQVDSEESKSVHVLRITLKSDEAGEIDRKLKVVTDLKEEKEIEFQAKGKIVP